MRTNDELNDQGTKGPLPVTFTGEESARLAGLLAASGLAALSITMDLVTSGGEPEVIKSGFALTTAIREMLGIISARQNGQPDPLNKEVSAEQRAKMN